MSGSVRVITDQAGELVSRRDFMPFGEEIMPDPTHRTTVLKYGAGDNIRRHRFLNREEIDIMAKFLFVFLCFSLIVLQLNSCNANMNSRDEMIHVGPDKFTSLVVIFK